MRRGDDLAGAAIAAGSCFRSEISLLAKNGFYKPSVARDESTCSASRTRRAASKIPPACAESFSTIGQVASVHDAGGDQPPVKLIVDLDQFPRRRFIVC